jgi:predicted RNA-binding Zn-ribbon protein involved in translation (DUF1610 family)
MPNNYKNMHKCPNCDEMIQNGTLFCLDKPECLQYEGMDLYKRQTPRSDVPEKCEWCNVEITKKHITRYLCEKCMDIMTKTRKRKYRIDHLSELRDISATRGVDRMISKIQDRMDIGLEITCHGCGKELNANAKGKYCRSCRGLIHRGSDIRKQSRKQSIRNAGNLGKTISEDYLLKCIRRRNH